MADKEIAEAVKANLARMGEEIAQRINSVEPSDKAFPLCIMVIASPMNDEQTMVHYSHTAICGTPPYPDGWAQAQVITRDMLLICARLDMQFSLGLSLVPGVLAQHVLMQNYVKRLPAQQPTVQTGPDGRRIVTDLAEVTTGVEGGTGATKH